MEGEPSCLHTANAHDFLTPINYVPNIKTFSADLRTDHTSSNGLAMRQRKSAKNHVIHDTNNGDPGIDEVDFLVNNDPHSTAADLDRQVRELENEMENFVHRMRTGLSRLTELPTTERLPNLPTNGLIPPKKLSDSELSCTKDADSSLSQKRDSDRHAPPRKTFATRNSMLTDLMQISHLRTMYNIAFAVFLLFFLTTFAYESIDHGGIKLDLSLLLWSFGKFPIALVTWCAIQLSTFVLLFVPFYTWAARRTAGPKRVGGWDYAMLAYCGVYQLTAIYLPFRIIIDYDLPHATALFLAGEQIRVLMKVHAYVREKAADVLNSATGKQELDFGKLLYFLFVPTLIYRDEYPRTKSTDWHRVALHFWHVGLCIFFLYYVFVRFLVPVFSAFTPEQLLLKGLVLSSFHAMFPGVMIMFIVFFGLLHSWMNAFAEALRFGDRQFYREWWNSTSFAQFYRNWNVIVHDWLHQYIYRDMVLLFMWYSGKGRAGRLVRSLALITVFLVSAVWHEYFVTILLHCFFPIMFMKFIGAGVFLYFLGPLLDKKQKQQCSQIRLGDEKPSSPVAVSSPAAALFASAQQVPGTVQNIIFWLCIFLGYGWLMCLFSTEYYARMNCSSIYNGTSNMDAWMDFLTWRMYTCSYYNFTRPTN